MYSLIRKTSRENDGFTLVELMVVVAIIGLLSAVAIPNFKKYQAKSKTSEAKLHLASIYSAEVSWFSDYDNYSTCLNLMGYDPSAESQSRYYTIGFAAGNSLANAAATNNGANTNCTGAGTTMASTTAPAATANIISYGGLKSVGGSTATPANLTAAQAAATVSATFDTFMTAAVGIIDAAKTTTANMDQWTITEVKRIRQPVVGF